MKYFLAIFILLCSIIASAQVETQTFLEDNKRVPREHVVDMQHAKIELSFKPEEKLVIGKVTHTFTSLQNDVNELFLDGINMTYKSVTVDGDSVQYEKDSKGITIKFAKLIQRSEEHTIVIEYEATPWKGLYFIGWDDPNNLSRKQIWSQGQGIDNRHWIPMYDEKNDKIVSEMTVKFDSNYKVLSNGKKLKEKENKDGTTTWHFEISHEHAPYLIMLGIGDYKIKESKSKNGTPMYFWYYPDWEDRVEWTYKNSEDMVDFFEETIGVKYPWGSYSQIPVQEFMYGAMENTTATIYGDFFHVDERAFLDRNYVAVNAHELAHQWFGDCITARTSTDHWLQESFATYYNMLYEKRFYGQDHFDWKRREGNDGSLKASLKDYKPIAHSKAGSTRHYPKGAFVLNMLKYVVGEAEFNASIKHYLEKHQYQNVDSEDLLIAFHETLGVSLDWFWDQWVYRGGEPHYDVEYADLTESGQRYTQFDVSQIHDLNEVVGLFKMPIWFEVHYIDGTSDTQQEWIEKEREIVKINNMANKDIAFVLFDPNNQVMKKVTFEKSIEMNVRQAFSAPMMLDRYDAIVAVRKHPVTQKQELLLKIYEQEKFHAIKAEIIAQLVEDESQLTIELLRKALQDNDVLVRKSVIANLRIIPPELLVDYENLLKDQSYQIVEQSLNKLCIEYPFNAASYLEITKDEVGAISKNVRIVWLEHSFNSTKNQENVNELIRYTSNSYEFKTRISAAQALQRLNYCNVELAQNLIQGMGSANSRLSNPCTKVFNYFYRQTALKHQIDVLVRNGTWSKKQQTKFNNIMR
ncbi:MAG: M1 family metallopeptidase [Flavobacteriales bacterium]|nr:M1 family metallopeptidase [Flavobacteriales bacterium]